MRNYIAASKLLLAIALMILCCNIPAQADDYATVRETYESIGVVQCPKYLNIRQRPDTNSPIVGMIKNSGVCEIKQEGDTWCAIKSGDITGYVLKQYLITGEAAYSLAARTATKRIRFNNTSTVYSSMNTNSKVWEKPVAGVVYDVAEDTGAWIKIDLDGAIGYVLSDGNFSRFYGLDTATRTYDTTVLKGERDKLVRYAMQFLGNQYVWGGNDPHTGADCSGFVKYVYKKTLNMDMPRVSYEQCYNGERISSLEMQPGDLIFYADSSGTVGHVAMYIGNGTIIHAASTKSGIKLSPWNYRTPKYIRRLL